MNSLCSIQLPKQFCLGLLHVSCILGENHKCYGLRKWCQQSFKEKTQFWISQFRHLQHIHRVANRDKYTLKNTHESQYYNTVYMHILIPYVAENFHVGKRMIWRMMAKETLTLHSKHNTMLVLNICTRKRYKIELYLQWPTNRKSHIVYRTAPFPMTLNGP